MSKGNMPRLNVLFFLQLILALYFVTAGITGVQNYNSYKAPQGIEKPVNRLLNTLGIKHEGKAPAVLSMIIAIVKIAAGAFLGLCLFLPFSRGLKLTGNFVAFFLQAFLVGYNQFYLSVSVNSGSISFSPNTLGWLTVLSVELVILLAIWAVRSNMD